MFQRVSFQDFVDAFRRMGCEGQISYEALYALFKYLEELEADTGEPIELDVIDLCCEYRESTVDEILDDYGLDVSECKDYNDERRLVSEFLNKNTTVIWSDGDTFLFRQF